jgi:hypothetical protein
MSIKLDAYHPLSHLGELLYKDSVAQRDAKIARETEEARQRSATDAQARLQLQEALDPRLRIDALQDPRKFSEDTPFANLFAQGDSQTGPSDPTSIGDMLTVPQQKALAGLPGAEKEVAIEQIPKERAAEQLANYVTGLSTQRMLLPQANRLLRLIANSLGAAGTGATTITEIFDGVRGVDMGRLTEIIKSPQKFVLDNQMQQLGHVANSLRASMPGGIATFPEFPTSAESPEKVKAALQNFEQLFNVSQRYSELVREAQQIAAQMRKTLKLEDYEELFAMAFED